MIMNRTQDQSAGNSEAGTFLSTPTQSSPICAWRFLDGKAGHRNQVTGLVEAISRRSNLVCHDVDVTSTLRGIRSLIPGRLDSLGELPPPTFLIGAGHATHFPMLAARRKFGAHAIVLMKPTLPCSLFDLCLIPKADGISPPAKNMILTEGALNRIQPSDQLDEQKGLILVGGPSLHFGWCNADVIRQIRVVIDKTPNIDWTITTSRRTPASFLDRWDEVKCRGRMVTVSQTDTNWLPSQLRSAGRVWVTNESISMIYEALTSGAAVGILTLPKPRITRVTRGVDSLIKRAFVTPFDQWERTNVIPVAPQQIDEASRCAELIMTRFFSKSDSAVVNLPLAARFA